MLKLKLCTYTHLEELTPKCLDGRGNLKSQPRSQLSHSYSRKVSVAIMNLMLFTRVRARCCCGVLELCERKGDGCLEFWLINSAPDTIGCRLNETFLIPRVGNQTTTNFRVLLSHKSVSIRPFDRTRGADRVYKVFLEQSYRRTKPVCCRQKKNLQD
jgi:hypothetical protein